MAVLQQYYTSFVNKETSSAGFQVKAWSPELSPEQQSLISRMIGYRIPPTASENPVETHPIALRYLYHGPHECIFLCSQSNGSDENGRPGNFFAHTLVMDPTIFTRIPPIFYWRSPFWKLRDPLSRTQLEPLPDFDIEPSLDFDDVWKFLAQREHLTQFHKLMCAVIHAQTTHRRIVIIDNADHVALWITAISGMLPPAYRPMLSFATYHHDPYQSQFLVTGTTTDSSFHASPEEYVSYFILDANTGKMSEVDDSPYATRVAQDAAKIIKMRQPDLYEELLLPLFTDYIKHFPEPTQIDEQLDLLALYANLLSSHHQGPLQPDEVEAIRIAIDALAQQTTYTEEDIQELVSLEEILWPAYEAEHDSIIQHEHDRVVSLASKHKLPTDKLILKILNDLTKQVLYRGEVSQATIRIENLYQMYGDDVITIINRPIYLQWLIQQLDKSKVNAQQLQDIWQCLGRSIAPSSFSQQLVQKSLGIVGLLLQQERIDEEQDLLDAMRHAMVGHEKEWLKLAVDIYVGSPDQALKHFYYFLVHRFPLQQRVSYRAMLQTTQRTMILYEVKNDIATVDPEHAITVLEGWVEHARQNQYETAPIVKSGLKQLHSTCLKSDLPSQWHALVPQILKNRKLVPLDAEINSVLVHELVSGLSLSTFSPTDIDLYTQYQDDPSLSDDEQTVLAGVVAMCIGKFDPVLSTRLNHYLQRIPREEYRSATKRFLTEFFKTPISVEKHRFSVAALYVGKYRTPFWHSYYQTIAELFLNTQTTKQTVAILSFWFSEQPATVDQKYVLQDFLLRLSRFSDDLQRMRGFPIAAREFVTLARDQDWYPLVQDLLSERKNVFVSAGQSVGRSMATQFQKLLTQQNSEKQKQEQALQAQQELEAHIANLFNRKKLRPSHAQNIPNLYSLHQKELFWRLYWQELMHFFLSKDIDTSLDAFSFWFIDAFNVFRQVPYIAQDFFIELPQAIEAVQKERNFRDAANKIKDTAYKQYDQARQTLPEGYQWFPLLQRLLFVEQKTR